MDFIIYVFFYKESKTIVNKLKILYIEQHITEQKPILTHNTDTSLI